MGKHVLVVMQDEYEASQMIRSLKEADFYAKDSYDDPPDLIVLDTSSRNRGAEHILTDIVRKFQASSMPVILLGGAPPGPIERLLLKFNTKMTVRKPFEPRDVIEVVKTLMQRLNIGNE